MLSQGYVIRALEAHGLRWAIRDGEVWAVECAVYPDGRAEDERVPTGSVEELKGWLGY